MELVTKQGQNMYRKLQWRVPSAGVFWIIASNIVLGF